MERIVSCCGLSLLLPVRCGEYLVSGTWIKLLIVIDCALLWRSLEAGSCGEVNKAFKELHRNRKVVALLVSINYRIVNWTTSLRFSYQNTAAGDRIALWNNKCLISIHLWMRSVRIYLLIPVHAQKNIFLRSRMGGYVCASLIWTIEEGQCPSMHCSQHMLAYYGWWVILEIARGFWHKNLLG